MPSEISTKRKVIAGVTITTGTLEWQPFLGLFFGRHLFLIINWS
ncbi:hypothetical protein [Spiroplasma endosymbiont of Panzeria rudis]